MYKFSFLGLLVFTAFALTSCGSSSSPKKATVFTGGAIAAFGGGDGGNPETRQIAREVMDLRTFDFITANFQVANGPVTTMALGAGRFGAGQGTLILGVERAVVLLNITTSDPTITNLQLSGEFVHELAQQAIDVPGTMFSASWRLSFSQSGVSRVITYDQELTGAQFVSVP